MSQQELLEVAEAVAALVPRLVRGLNTSEKDPAGDLPLAQLRLCGILSEGLRPMSALSRDLGVSLSALTQIADRLERARLVKRVAEGNDRRVRCLQLTVRGEKMMRKRREDRVLRTLAVLEPLAEQEREAVRSSLEILVDACATLQARDKNFSESTKTANGRANNSIAPARKRTAQVGQVPFRGDHSQTSSSKGPKAKAIP
jgi:DNA-binding MarR family transcriptional regulator